MKPEWKDAPKWAKYLAMDSNGVWYWYEEKPCIDMYEWLIEDGESERCDQIPDIDWENSLEEKPKA